MRPPSDMPPRPARRRRRPRPDGRGRTLLIIAVVAIFVLSVSLRGIASFYTDYLWFDSLGLKSIWQGVLGAKLALALIFTITFFLIIWVNLLVAERLAPPFRMGSGAEDDLVERYHELVGTRAGLIRTGVAVLLALIEGTSVSSQWQQWILFTNRVNFGTKDATFHTDIGFYVFQLPFLRFVIGWVFGALVIVLVATVVAHYLNGGIRLQVPGDRVSPQVKAHLSVLMGLLLLVKAGGYWMQRYELVFSTRGTVDGATYTDVNVQLKAIYLLIIISVTAFVLLLVNIRRRGWILPIIAVGLWAFVAILAGQVVPSLVQQFRVQPDEPTKEAPYIRHNIDATRDALGLADVNRQDFAADGKLTRATLDENKDVVDNIRLWDPAVAVRALQRSQGQGLRDYYTISDMDVDRYKLNGKVTQVNVAARELSTAGIPQKSWVAQHLTYTHGYGAVLSPANATTGGGQPLLDIQDVPVQSAKSAPKLTQPRVYIGEGQSGYAIVNSKAEEFDYQDDAGTSQTTVYTGKDGVRLNSIVRRAAFALRFGSPNPLISSNITDRSRILLERDVSARLKTVAPFLSFDSDPYPVLINQRVTWVVDAYTTTDRYPNAQGVDVADVPLGADLRSKFNYVRNSVKATVDAYDGTVTLYVVDGKDPIVRAYRKAFPDLFTDGSKAPATLRAHFRYPEDLFRVQTTMWGRYHMDDPASFYNRTDEWNVAPDPELILNSPDVSAAPTTIATSTNVSNQPSGGRVDPYYLQLRLPGEKKQSFTLLRPFVAGSQNNRTRALTAFLSVKSDPDNYGKLVSYRMPPSRLPAGPQDIVQAFNADSAVSRELTLLCQQRSRCTATNLLVIPIDQSLLYVRPLYVESEAGGENSPPQLERVIVAFQTGGTTEVKLAETLPEALDELFPDKSGTSTPPTTGSETPPETPSGQAGSGNLTAAERKLVDEISTAYEDAATALKAGNVSAWADKQTEAQRLFDQLQGLLVGSKSGGGSAPASGSGGGSGSATTVPSARGTTTVPSGSAPTTVPPTTTAPAGSATTTTKPSA